MKSGWCSCVLSHVPLFCNRRDWGLPGSSAHGIFQARILEWVAVSSSRGASQGLSPCLLRLLCWQVGSLPLEPPGKSGCHLRWMHRLFELLIHDVVLPEWFPLFQSLNLLISSFDLPLISLVERHGSSFQVSKLDMTGTEPSSPHSELREDQDECLGFLNWFHVLSRSWIVNFVALLNQVWKCDPGPPASASPGNG